MWHGSAHRQSYCTAVGSTTFVAPTEGVLRCSQVTGGFDEGRLKLKLLMPRNGGGGARGRPTQNSRSLQASATCPLARHPLTGQLRQAPAEGLTGRRRGGAQRGRDCGRGGALRARIEIISDGAHGTVRARYQACAQVVRRDNRPKLMDERLAAIGGLVQLLRRRAFILP